MTIHLVYPFDERLVAAPWTIGNHVAGKLRNLGYEVNQYDWECDLTIHPNKGDILIGHPHPSNTLAFCNSLRQEGWSKKFAIAPWNGSEMNGFLVSLLPHVDQFFAICGPYWRKLYPDMLQYKTTFLDMAVNPSDFPFIKTSFNEPKDRKLIYIGCTLPCKNPEYLYEIHQQMLWVEFGHIGSGSIATTMKYDMHHMNDPRVLHTLKKYDFMISVGSNDANPTTVLESICWGIIPITSVTSGWGDDVSILIPKDDASEAAAIIKQWLNKPEEELKDRQKTIMNRVLSEYTWDKFVEPINNFLTGVL